MTLRIVGVIAVIGGVATLFLGTERAQAILEWSSAQGDAFIRLTAGFALVWIERLRPRLEARLEAQIRDYERRRDEEE